MSNRHRVVVQLRDVDSEEERDALLAKTTAAHIKSKSNSNSSSNSSALNRFEKELLARSGIRLDVNDYHTLQLSRRNMHERRRSCQQMHFDCVGRANDVQTQAEFNTLIDQLILKQNNCCLLRFMVKRRCDQSFLTNLLVREVDKRMQLMQGYMLSIRLEYYDIQKFDVVSVFEKAVRLGAPRSKRVLRPRPRNHFSNTLELLKWFQDEYPQLFSVGRGHDIVEFHMRFSDMNRRIHRVKFALVQLYINKMDGETKSSLRNFLLRIGGQRKTRHCTLTDCLKEFFSASEMWRTWMIFDLPRHRINNVYIDDILKLANAAYEGIRGMSHQETNDYNLSLDLDSLWDCNQSDTRSLSNTLPLDNSKTKAFSPISSSTKRLNMFFTAKEGKPVTKATDKFSTKDLDSLSHWYCKMNEKFATVAAAMENYYEHKYGIKIAKIGTDITQMIRTIDLVGNPQIPLPPIEIPSLSNPRHSCNPEELQMFLNEYKTALDSFRFLTKEIEKSKFGDLLQVYLKTKMFELSQHALRFKVQQLQSCQSHLSEIINREVDSLHEQKQYNALMLNNSNHAGPINKTTKYN